MPGLAGLLLVSLLSAAPASAAQQSESLLRESAASGQTEALRHLLSGSEEVGVDAPDEAGWTALMHAARGGHGAVARLLLDAGANVHQTNEAQETALHLAAQHGGTEVARLLLAAGADYAARDAEGRTPLFRAIGGGHAEIIDLLHDAALVGSDRRSPVRAVVSRGETTPPTVIQWTIVPYTDKALAQGTEGTVVLMALVRPDGSVGAVNVSKGLEESLDRSARETVRRWRFEPATRDGKPVAVVVEIGVDFELPQEPR